MRLISTLVSTFSFLAFLPLATLTLAEGYTTTLYLIQIKDGLLASIIGDDASQTTYHIDCVTATATNCILDKPLTAIEAGDAGDAVTIWDNWPTEEGTLFGTTSAACTKKAVLRGVEDTATATQMETETETETETEAATAGADGASRAMPTKTGSWVQTGVSTVRGETVTVKAGTFTKVEATATAQEAYEASCSARRKHVPIGVRVLAL
ncbi:hypothetical protein BDW74DRAFT_182166 [Aspergillus multicolor]|uniref:uncharacterized protein n=1 Tax=Aspergillus multicolor TaxID=41759 RepID=UPI003CCCA622